jgi:hypothetical protein
VAALVPAPALVEPAATIALPAATPGLDRLAAIVAPAAILATSAIVAARAASTRAAIASAATVAPAAAAAATVVILADVRLVDRPARARHHLDPERAGAEPQEAAAPFLHHRDHGLGTGEPQRIESLANCLVERPAFEY